MSTQELLRNTNCKMIKGEHFSDSEKQKITQNLLSAVSHQDTVSRFHKGVKSPNDGRILYPLFYIPPYNDGKKSRLITGQLPKTQILSANHYELEILRILALWDKDNPKVQLMLDETLKRLDTTCFAHFCATGECVGAGIAVLRFLSVLSLRDDKWINEILTPMIAQYNNGHKGMAATNNNVPVFYLYSVLPDIANKSCYRLIEERKEWIIHMLTRGGIVGPAVQDTYNVTMLYILRNALAILPEYEYMKNAEVYISEKDNRCYCDVYKQTVFG